MRSDLDGLEITKGEVKHWSGVTPNQLYRPATVKKLIGEGFKTLIIGGILSLSYLIWVFIFPSLSLFLILINVSLFIILVFNDTQKILNSLTRPHIIQILNQLDQYNDLVKALKLYDELEEAGNLDIKIDNREAVIQALILIRAELIRAFRTEKILKKNKKFIEEHQEFFDPNFLALTILQTQEPKTEQSKLLYQAFQLASAVHEQFKQLQDQQVSR